MTHTNPTSKNSTLPFFTASDDANAVADVIYIQVALPTPVRQTFTYSAMSALGPFQPGMRVLVPFGRRTMVGIVIRTSDETQYPLHKLKPITDKIDKSPIVTPVLMKLCLWATNYYHHPIGEVFAAAIPAILRAGKPANQQRKALVLAIDTIDLPAHLAKLSRAPRQKSLLQLIAKRENGMTPSELYKLDYSKSVIDTLVSRTLVEWHENEQILTPFSTAAVLANDHPFKLSDEQENAISRIEANERGTTLLYGVTGSGKTEVYLQIISKLLRSGKQALVLVPEIGLTPQTIQRFNTRFNVPVVAIHSGMTDLERLNAYQAAATGHAGIVIGTRSAIFTPLHKPGVIIVDEEHDASFKQQAGFRYSARDLAVLRGQWEKIPVVLGSATPSLESYHNAKTKKYALAELTKRAGNAKVANYDILNIRKEDLAEGLSSALIAAMKKHLGAGNQVLVFLNRRGYSPVLLCHECGWIAQCNRCDARLTVHFNNLRCHHCSSAGKIPRTCPECRSPQLVPLGSGTQRIEQVLNSLFPDTKVIRVDRDSTRAKGSMEKVVSEITSGGPAILVGTQLLAKGHHFPSVTLVAIPDMDSGFYSSDYKAIEKMGQLLLQVGGRAGREEKPGVVCLQTHFPNEPVLLTLINKGYTEFAELLLNERQTNELPPYVYHAMIRAEAVKRDEAMSFLSNLTNSLPANPSAMVLGPIPSLMEKKAGKFRAQLLLSSNERGSLHQLLTTCTAIITKSKTNQKVRWSIDVDPIDSN
jgi:primosomal protein N' (replication factor Y)